MPSLLLFKIVPEGSTDDGSAIANDTDDIEAAKSTLDILQAEAIVDGVGELEEDTASPTAGYEFSDEDTSELGSLVEDFHGMTTAEDEEIGGNENLRFLKLSFPRQSLVTLTFVLNKCRDDVLKAVDELLNHELIGEERRLNAIVDGDDATIGSSSVDDFFAPSTARHRKRKQKSARHAAADLPDALQAPPKSRWAQMSAEVEWCAHALSLPPATVQSAYHAHASSLPAALNALIEETAWQQHTRTASFDDEERALHKAYPGIGLRKTQRVLDATKQDVTLATQVCRVLSAWRPALGSLTNRNIATTTRRDAASMTSSQEAGSTNTGIIPSHHGKTAIECRAMAQECAVKRDTAFRQAATAHQKSKSDGLHGGTAMYYAEVGRDFDAKMRAWNLQAAHLSSVQTSGRPNDLDLHGLSVHEGLSVTKQGLTKWYASTRMLESGTLVTPLRIITGLGNHSAGGEARLLPAVKKYLDREGWKYAVSGGSISVTGLRDK